MTLKAVILKRCPCGLIPARLFLAESPTSKWAYVSGSCCGEWEIEFRTHYHDLESDECMALAVEAWNEAPRAAALLFKDLPEEGESDGGR